MEDVLDFMRDYINSKSARTESRNQRIRDVFYNLTGERLLSSCQTCYIEALFKIKKIMEKTVSKYLLKPGALLQAFGDQSKTMSNSNITDELAEWHLKNNPGVAIYFSRIPVAPAPAPEEVVIVEVKAEDAKVDVLVDVTPKEVVKRTRKSKK